MIFFVQTSNLIKVNYSLHHPTSRYSRNTAKVGYKHQSINHHSLGSLEEAKYIRLTIDQVSFDLFHYFQQFLVYSRFIYVIKNLPWKLGYRKMLLRRLPVSKYLRPHQLSLTTVKSFLWIQ